MHALVDIVLVALCLLSAVLYLGRTYLKVRYKKQQAHAGCACPNSHCTVQNLSFQQGRTDSGGFAGSAKVAGLFGAAFGFTFAGVFDGPWPPVCTYTPSHRCLRVHLRGVHG